MPEKKSFYPTALDATKNLSEVVEHAVPIVSDMFNTLGGVPPTFIIGIQDQSNEHCYIIMTATKDEIMPAIPMILHNLGTRLGMLQKVNDIKQVDFMMFCAESTQVKIDKANPEHVKVQKELEKGMKVSDAPETMKKDTVIIAARNIEGKHEIRNLEVKQSINFIDKEMVSATKTLHLSPSEGEVDTLENKFADLFFSSYQDSIDEKSSSHKKFMSVLKALGTVKEYEAMLANKKGMQADPDRIHSQIDAIVNDLPEELRNKIIIRLAK